MKQNRQSRWKKTSILLLIWIWIFCALCGCGIFGGKSYVVVKPHDEDYEVALDSNALTVSSYLSLKNAILDLVEDGVEEGVIRAESYSGDLTEDLRNAVYEVQRGEPLGAFAVDYMTYDCSKIVSYYEINIHTTFRRSVEEMETILQASGTDGVKARVREAMEDYAPMLRLRVSGYQEMNFDSLVQQIFRENPEFAMEQPDVQVTSYPELGSQRILEIEFQYVNDQSTLIANREALQSKFDNLVTLYGSNNDDTISARRFYVRLARDGILAAQLEENDPFVNSVYGALIKNVATSYGYAQAYLMLLRAKDIPCHLVEGRYLGQAHSWCQVILDDVEYYVDPARGVMTKETDQFLMTADEQRIAGYLPETIE